MRRCFLRRRGVQRPIAAALVTTLLVFPTYLLGQTQESFDVLVVGDSLIWGQGLEQKDKIFTHVVNWLRDGAGLASWDERLIEIEQRRLIARNDRLTRRVLDRFLHVVF